MKLSSTIVGSGPWSGASPFCHLRWHFPSQGNHPDAPQYNRVWAKPTPAGFWYLESGNYIKKNSLKRDCFLYVGIDLSSQAAALVQTYSVIEAFCKQNTNNHSICFSSQIKIRHGGRCPKFVSAWAPTNFDRYTVLIAPYFSHCERSQTNRLLFDLVWLHIENTWRAASEK